MDNKQIKYCFIFLTHKWNNQISYLYHTINEQLSKVGNIDCMIFYDSKLKLNRDHTQIPKSYKQFSYPHTGIWTKFKNNNRSQVKEAVDPFKGIYLIINKNKNFFEQYDYFYFYEYDIYYNGDLGEYIKKLNQYDVDLFAAHIQEVPSNDKWPFIQYYNYFLRSVPSKEYKMEDIHFYIKACLSFFRISKKMLFQILDKKYWFLISNVLYELHLPTLVYHLGGTIKSIGSKLNNQFDMFEDLTLKTYAYEVEWKSINQIKNLPNQAPLFYTRVKI